MTADAGDVQVLNTRFGATGLHFEIRFGGTVAVMTRRGATAAVALQGAQVISYVPAAGSEVLWLSPVANIVAGKALRGGIPICWPWFGPHPNDPAQKAHGFVRASPWQVTNVEDDGASIAIKLIHITSDDAAGWSHVAAAEVTVRLSDVLSVVLETKNSSATSFGLSEALHTYVRVGEISDVGLTGLEGVSYIDQLAPGRLGLETQPIQISQEIDRIYVDSGATVVVHDPNLRRSVRIAKSGSLSTVIWNPWIDKARRLGDMGDDGYRHMVCVEAANAAKNSVTIAPGERHRIETTVSVEPV